MKSLNRGINFTLIALGLSLVACSPQFKSKGRPKIQTTTPGFNTTSSKSNDTNTQDQNLNPGSTQISPDFYGEWQIRGTECGDNAAYTDTSQTYDGRITILGSQLVNNYIDYDDESMTCRLEESYDVQEADSAGTTLKISMSKMVQTCEAKDGSWSDPTEYELKDSDRAPRVIRLEQDGYGNLRMYHLSGDNRCGGNGTAIDIFTMNSAYI
jgi:hypothetical protein